MTEFRIVEGKPWHCGAIARIMRREQAQGTVALGFREHDTIASAFAMSLIRRAWMVDGQLAALGGFLTEQASWEAIVWVAISQRATKYPIAMFKTAVATLRELLQTRNRIATTIVKSDARSKAFAERLGFVANGVEAEGGGVIVMQLVREIG